MRTGKGTSDRRNVIWAIALALVTVTGCAADGEIEDENSSGYKTVLDAITSSDWGAQAIARAEQWVDARVPYSHDPIASGVGYGHRADCSGLVSYAWRLAAPSHTTYSFATGPWDDGVSVRIPLSDLRPGDALNFAGDPGIGTGHIMLFVRWLDDRYTFEAIEEIAPGYVAQHTTHTLDTQWNPDMPGRRIRDLYVGVRSRNRPTGSGDAGYRNGSTTGCSMSASGGSAVWTCTRDGTARQHCVAGSTVTQTCAQGCVGQPIGVDDYCRAYTGTSGCSDSASGTSSVWTCTADGTARQRCVSSATQTDRCSIGCQGQPSGVDDYCIAYTTTAGCRSSASGTSSIWTCTADTRSRQRCVAGNTQTDPCNHGCIGQPTGVNDYCASSSEGGDGPTGAARPLSGTDSIVLAGSTLAGTEAGWVRYIARNVVPRVGGATRDDRIRNAAYVTWWALKEGFLTYRDAYYMSVCLEAGRNVQYHSQPHSCLGVMWQQGLAAIQVHDHSAATVEATATARYGGSVSDVVRTSLRLAGIDPTGTHGRRVLADTGSLRKSWLMRAPGVGFTLEAPLVIEQCFGSRDPGWCFGVDYARDRANAATVVNGLIAYFRSHAP